MRPWTTAQGGTPRPDVLLEGHLLLEGEGDILLEGEGDVLLEGEGDVLLKGHFLLEKSF